jgi:hypothetical protein
MRCPGEELDTRGELASGIDQQPFAFPNKETVGSNNICMEEKNHQFGTNRGERYKCSINQCESHVRSGLDTKSLSIDSRDSRKLKFLVDTGAEISIIKSSSLTAGVEYQLCEGVDTKRISF